MMSSFLGRKTSAVKNAYMAIARLMHVVLESPVISISWLMSRAFFGVMKTVNLTGASSIPHRRLQKITVMQIIEVIDTSAIQMFIRRHPRTVRLRCRRPV